MITAQEIKTFLSKSFPDADITVKDLTGTLDHFEVEIESSLFRGHGLIGQHQMVNQALASPLEDGRIHALKIRTRQK